jgi:signal peptidase I
VAEPAHDIPTAGPVTMPVAKPKPQQEKSVAREYAEAMVIAFTLALIIRTFLFQAYKIPSGSMEPTLLIGDHILVNKIIYGLRMPDSIFGLKIGPLPYGRYFFRLEQVHHGDVIVFVFPPDRSKDFIKRVIGIGGDTVQIIDGKPWVNRQLVSDPHAHYEYPDEGRSSTIPRDHFGPLLIPPGKLFVMGDNRDSSYDSRFWGVVDDNDVEGRATVIYFPWSEEKADAAAVWHQILLWYKYVNWNRVGMIVR